MALVQKFTLTRSTNYQDLIVTDITGAYDPVTNPTGYGGVNPSASDFTTFSITFYLPDASTLLPQSTGTAITAVYPTLPSDAGASYTITSSTLLGSTSNFIDGQYKIVTAGTYDIGAGDVTATPVTVYADFADIVRCCIQRLRANTPLCGDCEECEGKNKRLDRAFSLLYMLFPQVNSVGEVVESYISENGLYNLGVDYILYLQEVCDSENCGQPCSGC